ncbi:uncharacterized protein LOC119285266 [Triticum dicoccoides]|uniref:Uncharacterized protein n=1 Tax=Triticum turgidum subsp. durum TaxID=4567 RepID=A0A9R0S7U8_TRITD|nr:uncharacterized protein LOC119285266 [Triticum dicoccoides]VAH89292.1 unnamed protein product [Triticum turgidum subsp. durum]
MCAVLSPLHFLKPHRHLRRYCHTPVLCPTLPQMDHGGGGRGMAGYEAAAAAASTNQKTESFGGCSSSNSVKKIYPIDSPIKKRKSQYDLSDTRLSSLKYKFQDRPTSQEDETARTESLGGDDIFINKNCNVDMVNVYKGLDSCENTQSLLGGCIEVDSINGIESRSVRKWASASSSSSNSISLDTYSSFHSYGTKETDSWVRPHLEHDGSGLLLQAYDDDILKICYVMNELAGGGVDGSADRIMDETLYSNGIDDFMILPAGKNGEKKKQLTIDQEFEQYFSKLML